MTEFVVVASLVLIPLFVLIPLLGKYIDIKHAGIQAARYQAWEYTVWHKSNDVPDGYNSSNGFPVKTVSQTRSEAQQRFYSDTSLALSADDKSLGWQSSTRRPLWTDHSGQYLYTGPTSGEGSKVSEDETPDILGLTPVLINVLDTAFTALAKVLSFLGIDAGFTALDADGYFKSATSIDTAKLSWFDPDNELTGVDAFKKGLVFEAEAGVLAHSWNAGGGEHAAYQVRGLVPTSLLDNPILNTVQDVMSWVAPELGSDSLQFGYVDYDSVPPDRLTPQTQTINCDETKVSGKVRGICELEDL